MAKAVRRAFVILSEAPDGVDFTVVQTLRSDAEARANALSGAGIEKSCHLANELGFAEALDFKVAGVDANGVKLDPYHLPSLRIIRGAILQALDEDDVPSRSGSDWNCNGVEIAFDPAEKGARVDFVHVEKVRISHWRYKLAVAARERRMTARKNGERWPL